MHLCQLFIIYLSDEKRATGLEARTVESVHRRFILFTTSGLIGELTTCCLKWKEKKGLKLIGHEYGFIPCVFNSKQVSHESMALKSKSGHVTRHYEVMLAAHRLFIDEQSWFVVIQLYDAFKTSFRHNNIQNTEGNEAPNLQISFQCLGNHLTAVGM